MELQWIFYARRLLLRNRCALAGMHQNCGKINEVSLLCPIVKGGSFCYNYAVINYSVITESEVVAWHTGTIP